MSSKKEMLANIVNAIKGTSWGENFLQNEPYNDQGKLIAGKPLDYEEPKPGVEHPRQWHRLGVFLSHAETAGIQENCPKEKLSHSYEKIAKYLLDNPNCSEEEWKKWLFDHKSELAIAIPKNSDTSNSKPRTPKESKAPKECDKLASDITTVKSDVKTLQTALDELKQYHVPTTAQVYIDQLSKLTTAQATLSELEAQMSETYTDDVKEYEIDSYNHQVQLAKDLRTKAEGLKKKYEDALKEADEAEKKSLELNKQFQTMNGMSIAEHTAKYGYDLDSKKFYELPQKGQEK